MRLRAQERRRPTWPHRPTVTARSRLAWLYGALSLASGAVLLLVTALLWGSATKQPIVGRSGVPGHIFTITGIKVGSSLAPPKGASRVAQGLVATSSQVIDHAKQAKVVGQLTTLALQQHTADLHDLLVFSAIALGMMAVLSLTVGWLSAGRILRPLRAMTTSVRDISATNLHRRLDLDGPEDELKELGDTFDDLLGRLERSFQSQRQFVANASHELRTPFATMQVAVDVAMAKPGPLPPETTRLAGVLHDELDRVERILDSFLSLARAQAGPPADGASPCEIDELTGAALNAHREAIAAKGLRVRARPCPSAMVAGDEELLARMVGNLVDNAVRHILSGGWLGVETAVTDGVVHLVVENGGPVLDPGAVAELTRPFRRLGPERTGSGTGLGLGLSIVSAIAEAHGGRAVVDAPPGGGFRVLLELPLAARVPVAAAA